jgi:hypothetical protein
VFQGFSLLWFAGGLTKMQVMVEQTFIEKIKVDKWYGIVLYLGILAAGSSLLKGDELLSRKHLFGFGAGCILTGLSFFIAQKKENFTHQDDVLFRDITKHNWITALILILGIFLLFFFGIRIFKELL